MAQGLIRETPIEPLPGLALRPAELVPVEQLPGGDEPPQESPSPFPRLIAAFKRFKWLMLAVTIVGSAAGVLATRFVKPLYAVQGTLLLEQINNGRGGPIQSPQLMNAANMIELLKSYVILDYVVSERHLYLSLNELADSTAFDGFQILNRFIPDSYVLRVEGNRLTLENKDGTQFQNGTVGDSIGKTVGFVWAPSAKALKGNRNIEFTVVTPREAATQLNENLTIRVPEGGNFIKLAMTGPDPKLAAATLNTLIRRFTSVSADFKKQRLVETTDALATQLSEADAKLREIEGKLQGFRVNTITEPRDDAGTAPIAAGLQMTSGTVMGDYTRLKLDLENRRQERRSLENVLQTMSTEPTVDAFLTIPSVNASLDLKKVLNEISVVEGELRPARLRYTEEHEIVKKLKEKLETLRNQTLPVYANALIARMKTEEKELEDRIESSGREIKEIPGRTITESRLQRDYESAQSIQKNLQGRYQEAKLSESYAVPDAGVLDTAVAPTQPTQNTASRLILMGFAGSLGLAVLLALLLDRLDRRFRYPEQATHDLHLEIFGVVPHIRRQRRGGVAPPEEVAQIVEAFRSIRLNLAHSFPGNSIALTISSPGPEDGKSLIASNLALSFSQAGYRTVLVDGDIRRGELYKTFAVERRPGLMDYLMGQATPDDILLKTQHDRLTVIPSGTRFQRGPELLSSSRMHELYATLRNRFEVVLVDSPPLGAGIDPYVLGTITGNLMVVLRTGGTDRQMAEAKIQMLDRLPIRVLGAVLNDIKSTMGHYRYYGYTYGYGVEAGDEAETENLQPVLPAQS